MCIVVGNWILKSDRDFKASPLARTWQADASIASHLNLIKFESLLWGTGQGRIYEVLDGELKNSEWM